MVWCMPVWFFPWTEFYCEEFSSTMIVERACQENAEHLTRMTLILVIVVGKCGFNNGEKKTTF